MTALRSLSLSVLALSLVAGLASAQSLAELAKKEKERREKNDAEAERVITDRELSSTYGGLPSTSASRTTGTSTATETEGGEGAPEGSEGEEGEEGQDETQTREYWQSRVSGTKAKIASLEEQLASNEWGEGQRMGVDPRGVNNLQQRQQVEQELAAARAELAAIQEEARRAGVPPGWVR